MRVFVTAPTPPTSTLVRPFTVSISDSEIDDVKQRLARTLSSTSSWEVTAAGIMPSGGAGLRC